MSPVPPRSQVLGRRLSAIAICLAGIGLAAITTRAAAEPNSFEARARAAIAARAGNDAVITKLPDGTLYAETHLEALAKAEAGHVALRPPTSEGLAGPQQGDCDADPCIIYGVAQVGLFFFIDRINVCTGGVLIVSPPVPVLTVATTGSMLLGPNLVYGTAAGGRFCSSGWPPPLPLVACGTVAVGSTALTAGAPGQLFAGSDIAAAIASLHDPTALVGTSSVPFDYAALESDLVCDPLGNWGMMADAGAGVPAVNSLVSVSRANGQQFLPRPPLPPGRPEYNGLAYDGFGRLWGTRVIGGMGDVIERLNEGTGLPISAPIPIVPGMTDLSSNECLPGCSEARETSRDLGDAPDSTNHFALPMLAYPGVPASFPSVSDLGTGAPPGPFHRDSQDSYLGPAITGERDADLLPDSDLVTNIDPLVDVPNRDGADDGVLPPVYLPACRMTNLNYRMAVMNGTHDRYTNVWFDYNGNGAWGDLLQCTDPDTQQVVTVSEWAVQNQVTALGAGFHNVITPQFRSLDPEDELWMRITLAETVAPASDGSGYVGGYEIGETEDYLLVPMGGGSFAFGN